MTGAQTLTGVNGYSGATTYQRRNAGAGRQRLARCLQPDDRERDIRYFGINGAGTQIQSLAGGGQVALGARTLSITNASDTFTGAIGGSGGFTVAGGTRTLAGVNTYTGATDLGRHAGADRRRFACSVKPGDRERGVQHRRPLRNNSKHSASGRQRRGRPRRRDAVDHQ